MDLATALQKADAAARAHVASNAEGSNWYPCGFVWASVRMRKNAKEARTLIAAGYHWDDYAKAYTLSMGTYHNTQSMSYKEGIGNAYVGALEAEGFTTFRVKSYID